MQTRTNLRAGESPMGPSGNNYNLALCQRERDQWKAKAEQMQALAQSGGGFGGSGGSWEGNGGFGGSGGSWQGNWGAGGGWVGGVWFPDRSGSC